MKNPFKQDMTFTVESDVPYVGGETEITIPANGVGSYKLVATPQVKDRDREIERQEWPLDLAPLTHLLHVYTHLT